MGQFGRPILDHFRVADHPGTTPFVDTSSFFVTDPIGSRQLKLNGRFGLLYNSSRMKWQHLWQGGLQSRVLSKLLLESPEQLLVLECNLLVKPPHALDASVADPCTQKIMESEGAEDRLSSQVMHESSIHRKVFVILGP